MKAGRVDWEEANRRIQAADEVLARILFPPPQEIARILKARAEFLAMEIEQEAANDAVEVLEFRLGEAHYGLESKHVRGVHRFEQLTRIPCTPDFVLGIVSVRGEILSVVDILKFFGLSGTRLGEMIIVLQKGGMRFCLLADAVFGVRGIGRAAISPSPPSLPGAEYLMGMAPGHLIMLDAVKLLTDERLVVEEEA